MFRLHRIFGLKVKQTLTNCFEYRFCTAYLLPANFDHLEHFVASWIFDDPKRQFSLSLKAAPWALSGMGTKVKKFLPLTVP